MANTKYILEQIKINGEFKDLISKSDGENVAVTYNGTAMTLSEALTNIFTDVSTVVSREDVQALIGSAVDDLIGGAPETYDTLKEIADYIAKDESAAVAMTQVIAGKVDKVDGKQLSTEDFTSELKAKLESMTEPPVVTESANGLMSSGDKRKLDALRGVRYGTTPPETMQEGELFVRVVSGE